MKKNIKNLCFLLFLFCLMVIPFAVKADNRFENNRYTYEYVLTDYDINIKVKEDNVFEITEDITAYFNVSKHGIFRKIPLKNEITRLDGTTSKNRARISKISVNEEYEVSTESGYRVIKIGDPDYTLHGEKNYVISYNYHLGKDTGKEYDELYFNLIGSEWDTMIDNVTFTIEMPKDFDETKLGFSSGEVGTIGTEDVSFTVDDNIIKGKLNSSLMPEEALTVRLELPEGYFVASSNIDPLMILAVIVPIIFALIAIGLWRKYGKDDLVVETVEFYPPKGYNSLDIGFLHKGKANNKDVTSLLVYLANKGYIKIVESEEKSLFKDKNFKIIKLKDYDGTDKNEKNFLDGLFKVSKPTVFGMLNGEEKVLNEVTAADLHNNFYRTMNEILLNVNHSSNRHKIFEKSASSKTIFIILMLLMTYALITIPPIYNYGEMESLIFALLFPGIGFSVLFSGIADIIGSLKKHAFEISSCFLIFWGLMFGGIPWFGIVLPTLLFDSIYLLIYLIGLLCVLVMSVCLKYLPKRTKFGNEILGQIHGFKKFLETAEKEKLEMMVMENPTYFYDILPYTYVLGVSDKWIKKFETISMQEPNWYDSPNGFDVVRFGTFMNNTMTSAQASMSSSPSSSGSGGSGGGSSGGGSGGGGGGSW